MEANNEEEVVPLAVRQISAMQRAQAAADALEQLHLANGVSLDEVSALHVSCSTRKHMFPAHNGWLLLLLLQMTCVALNKDGFTRCHRKKAEGFDFCWQHQKEEAEKKAGEDPANEKLKAELAECKAKIAEFEAKELLEKQIKEGEEMAKAAVYKTALCKYFEKGDCKLGDKCTFAHGNAELRKVGEHRTFSARTRAPSFSTI